jgi:glutamine amidotransferase
MLSIKWGIQWAFAHNGDVPLFKCARGELPSLGCAKGESIERIYNPVGDTDSEKIFCSILNALKAEFSECPSLPELHDYLRILQDEIVDHDREETILNFLLTCGEHVRKFFHIFFMRRDIHFCVHVPR